VDGLSAFGAFLRISLPLATAGTATACVLAAVFSWNNFMFALILSGENTKTLPVALFNFISYASVDWGGLMAARHADERAGRGGRRVRPEVPGRRAHGWRHEGLSPTALEQTRPLSNRPDRCRTERLPMRIAHAEVIVTCPGRNFVTLEITTDDGVVGYGDGTLNGRELSVVSYLRDHVVPLLIRPRPAPDRGHLAVPVPVVPTGGAARSPWPPSPRWTSRCGTSRRRSPGCRCTSCWAARAGPACSPTGTPAARTCPSCSTRSGPGWTRASGASGCSPGCPGSAWSTA